MKILSLLVLSSCLLISTSCVGIEPKQPLPTVATVDLTRYTGTWYEIARLPMWFQRHCVHSTAIYAIRQDGKISVHNECLTNRNTVDHADGVATVVDSTSNARLMVTFDNFFARLVGPSREGNYWIVHLDSNYTIAMIGTPDRRYLWILSRTQQLDEAIYGQLVTKAQQLGFPVSDLIKAPAPPPR